MKRTVPIKVILSLIVLMLFLGCLNRKKEKNEVNSNLDTTTSQELKFAQKRIVYQIPEMKDVICHKGIVYHSVNGIDLKADIYIPPTHDIDVLDDTETSKLIIKQTVDFMKTHLLHK